MTDFNFITSNLATGGAITSPDDVVALANAGVTHVIDCRIEFDDALLLSSSFTYLYNGVSDDGQPKPVEWFHKSLGFALVPLVTPGVKVYAHCAAGVNRGPSTAYALLRGLGLSPVTSEQLIRTARPQVNIAYMRDADAAIKQLFNF